MLSPQFLQLVSQEELADSRDLLISAYKHSINSGGMKETDFEREAGSSYNPRPARISYILYREAAYRNPRGIAAAMLAILEECEISAARFGQLPQEVLSLAREARRPVSEQNFEEPIDSLLIASACRLDRARHLHLSPKKAEAVFLKAFIRETQGFLEASQRAKLPLSMKLAQWIRRAETWV